MKQRYGSICYLRLGTYLVPVPIEIVIYEVWGFES